MLRTAPLFKGDCEISQLFCIFQVLGLFEILIERKIYSFSFLQGTPNESLWPGVSLLPNYTSDFPQWSPTSSFRKYVHLSNDIAEDLLSRCLTYIPEQRLTAKQALQHAYFLQDDEPISLS